jgi:hypothetical protein
MTVLLVRGLELVLGFRMTHYLLYADKIFEECVGLIRQVVLGSEDLKIAVSI